MRASKSTRLEMEQIYDPDPKKQEEKRSLWASYKKVREEFLAQLRQEGIKGSNYSDAVVEWDQQHMFGFNQMFNNVRGDV